MIYLLDANASIRYLRAPKGPIGLKFRSLPSGVVKCCDVVAAELYYGCFRSDRVQKNLEITNEFLKLFEMLPFDLQAAEIYGRIRAELEAIGQRIGSYDLQIAAIALANDATLVTHNTREFARVNGLKLEDWEVQP